MEARNRSLPQWFERIRTRQMSLPRFQRLEAWGPREVANLLTTILRGLPAGATLILEVGDQLPFVHRAMVGAPTEGERITELLLDGQQRLTAIWRALTDDYPDHTYLVFFEDDEALGLTNVPTVYGQRRWSKNGQRFPQWADDPEQLWSRGYIPARLLRPGDVEDEVDAWIDRISGADLQEARRIGRIIAGLRANVARFNLPFLSLPVGTPKEVALDVFIKMNTSSVPLSTFDVIVAQLEAETGQSLRDLVDALHGEVPDAAEYQPLEEWVLETAALMQGKPPNQTGYWALDLNRVVDEWDQLVEGVRGAVGLLGEEGVFDAARLPTDAPLGVVAALWPDLPTQPDALGNARVTLRRYLWRSFLTTRYDRAAATGSFADFKALSAFLKGEGSDTDVPIFNEAVHPLPTEEELLMAGWPKNRGILPRGMLALATRAGARDIADDARASRAHVRQREYHHLFPQALLRLADVKERDVFRALNCALITWRTNRSISSKEPITYLRERARANTLGERDLAERLRSHLVPYEALAVGGYDQMSSEQRVEAIVRDYDAFVKHRARVVRAAIQQVAAGRHLDLQEAFSA
ncbi:MAG TPA: DUF262 domain-containing protein [Gemmatimonadaceae bacterium]|nr:DUF262 domain-containing protein [Gemmatimonadaceae bacterium]